MGKPREIIKTICNNVYPLAKDYLKKMDLIIKKNKIVAGIAAGFFVLIGVPILLNILVIGNNISSNASNDAWASFFGSYFGGIFGGALTLIGVRWTITEQRKVERKRERPILVLMKKGDIRASCNDEPKLVYAHITRNENYMRFENMVLKNIGTQAVQYSKIIIENNSNSYLQHTPILPGDEYNIPELIYYGSLGDTIGMEIIYYDFYNKEYSVIIDCNVNRDKFGSVIDLIYIPEINTKLQ